MPGMKTTALRFVLAGCLSAAAAFADVRLPAILADHAVLQQQSEVTLWGWADPGESVSITADWWTGPVAATADPQGRWSAKITTLAAGGPHQIKFSGKNTIELKDIYFGEVWFCSGQSNMEWTVGPHVGPGVDNAAAEVQSANHPLIRMFTVVKERADAPKAECQGAWTVCSPETVAKWSATAYFFGRKLNQELNVPIGLIHSSWGGTEIELWISEPAFEAVPEFAKSLEGKKRALVEHEKVLAEWREKCLKLDPGWEKWNAPGLDDKTWTPVAGMAPFEKIELGDYDGVVWFRGEFNAPDAWAGKPVKLDFGPIDDRDITWVNGRRVGETDGWNLPRAYDVPAGVVNAGRNSVVIRVHDTGVAGGMNPSAGQPAAVCGVDRISIGSWRFMPAVEQKALGAQPQPPRTEHSTLFNAMVAPLTQYRVRGFIWYQGESNVTRAEQYATAFPAMIRDWREQWGGGELPFYYVQIAPFRYSRRTENVENWNHPAAELREVQRRALAIPQTGMVVTTDITASVDDIHPPNKQDVGARLGLWALAQTYGQSGLVHSGPLYREMTVEGDAIRLRFDHVGGGLVARGEALKGFIIAGENRAFVRATATIDGDSVVVRGEGVAKPAAVRFGWSDIAQPNFFNKEGLPASPFRTDEWPMATQNTKW